MLWLKLGHPNIIPLFGVADGFGSLPALVLPWLENGALTGYLQREHETLSYNARLALVWDIARGLHYRMFNGLSCVKPQLKFAQNNVLVDEVGKASLTDFGLSALVPGRISEALMPTDCAGTIAYMAPECLALDDEGNESAPVLSPKSDVYSFGGIMLQARRLDHQY
ncbi:kinase-like protein [Suillus hirtellus]|nr:kinase-like protein [Suillus hirtellus]